MELVDDGRVLGARGLGNQLPTQRVHVVTVPPSGSDPLLLWRKFAGLCGIDADTCDTSGGDETESLTVESACLLQLLGPLLSDAVDADTGERWDSHRRIRRSLANTVLIDWGRHRIRLADTELAFIRERTAASLGALRAAAYSIVGDLEELSGDEPPREGRHPKSATAEELL